MCGRYALYHSELDLTPLFGAEAFGLSASYNVAPMQQVPILRSLGDGGREFARARWGLIPHWVKDAATFKANLFNARSETAAEKPSFRDAMRQTRCLVPASGFYEWKREGARKQPYFIRAADGAPLAFAGLWSSWHRGEASLTSCTILTTRPNELMAGLHDRMPVILRPEDFDLWLDRGVKDARMFEGLFEPFPTEGLEAYPVSAAVGNPRNDGPELIEQISFEGNISGDG